MKRVTNHSFILKVNGRAAEIKSNCEITLEVKFASCIKAQVNKQYINTYNSKSKTAYWLGVRYG